MRHAIKLTAIVIILSSLQSYGQSFSPARLDSLFTAMQRGNQAMGSVCITKGGKVIYSRAFGIYEPGAKANTQTQYRIGSLTKMFTALMILQLVNEHKLALKTPIGKYFPQLGNAGTITVDQLLSHTSGLPDFTTAADYKAYAYTKQTRAAMLNRVARFKMDFAAGQKTVYSNTNYLLLGYIIEQVTGKSFAVNLQQRVTGKLGLRRTTYQFGLKSNQATSFSYNGGDWQPVPGTDMSVPGGAGAMLSTPADLAVFIRSLFKLKLCDQQTLASMTPVRGSLGRGLIQVPIADMTAYGHFGIIDGFKNSLLYLPQSDLAFAVCINSANTDDNALVDRILSITLQQLSRKLSVPAAVLNGYVGNYVSRQLSLPITLRAAGGYLLMQAGDRQILTLETLSPTHFRYPKGDMELEFSSPQGNKSHFTLKQGGRVFEYFK